MLGLMASSGSDSTCLVDLQRVCLLPQADLRTGVFVDNAVDKAKTQREFLIEKALARHVFTLVTAPRDPISP